MYDAAIPCTYLMTRSTVLTNDEAPEPRRVTRQFRVLTWSRGLLAPRRGGPLRGEDRLPTGSDFLSVMRGHEGLSLREVVKWLSEVHRCALLSEGTENCSCVLCYSYQRIRKRGVACFILCGLIPSP